jgi:hypothetical protein
LDESNILQETQEYAENTTELLNNYTDFETLVRNSQLKCGCTSIIDDYTTPDGNCQSVIYYIELLKRDITQNKSSHKFKNSVGATGQLSVNNICIDRLQVKFMGDNIEVDPQSKQKASTGIDFSVPNSSNIVLSINVLDEEKKLEKIDAVWKYLGGKVPEHQATFPITGAQLHEIFSGTSQERCDEVASIINKYSDKFEINTPLRMAHFLGQIGVESANLNAMGTKSGENPCYKKTNNAWTYNSGRGQGWITKKKWSETPIMEGCDDFTEDLKGKRKHPNWNSIDDVPKKFVCSTENPSSISGKNLLSYVYRCEGGMAMRQVEMVIVTEVMVYYN